MEGIPEWHICNVPFGQVPSVHVSDGSAAVLDAATLDRLRGLALVSRDTRLLTRLMGLFVQDTDVRLVAMRAAVERREDSAVRAIAHTVRGAAATLGAVEMVELCSQLEHMPRSWTTGRITRGVDALGAAFQRARIALEQFVADVEQSL
jgi:HPt (histidine-containing phosphotransfer) domain-containing protein